MLDEGYIKFNCLWSKAPSLDSKEIQELMDYRGRVYNRGWIGLYPDSGIGFGNISVLHKAADCQFIISGSKTGGIQNLGPEGYSKVNQVDIHSNTVWCSGPIAASSESMTHAMCYQCAPEIKAVIHIHHLPTWKAQLGQLPTTEADVAYGTVEMAEAVRRLFYESNLTDTKVFVMAGHREGIVALGRDLGTAFNALEQYVVEG
ncbi:MAG: class II aldolase/adducin family protein [Bacteroidota bacterium]